MAIFQWRVMLLHTDWMPSFEDRLWEDADPGIPILNQAKIEYQK
jgi:hypothetical protein